MIPETVAALNVKQAVPFFSVTDITASLALSTLTGSGSTMTQQWVPDDRIRWRWLELGNAALMLAGALARRDGPRCALGRERSAQECRCVFHVRRRAGHLPRRHVAGILGRRRGRSSATVSGTSRLKDPDGYHLHFASPDGRARGDDLTPG